MSTHYEHRKLAFTIQVYLRNEEINWQGRLLSWRSNLMDTNHTILYPATYITRTNQRHPSYDWITYMGYFIKFLFELLTYILLRPNLNVCTTVRFAMYKVNTKPFHWKSQTMNYEDFKKLRINEIFNLYLWKY